MLILLLFVGFFGLFLRGNGNIGHNGDGMDGHVSFVVVGGTGDLAKRKIWPSVAELVHRKELDLHSVHFYAGSRDTATVTRNLLTSYFSEFACADHTRACDHEYNYQVLLDSISAVTLKTGKDYTELNQQINNRMNEVTGREILRVFYLAVPPFAYSGIIANINEFCRPSASLSEGTKLRIAIEKPFGRDLNSAQLLANDMRKFLSDDEVYLVDHYLHKEGVKQIRNFLTMNYATLLPIWNNKYIDYIEIVAREGLDVKGRSKYYDTYGVIRDMHQSHLTELLLLIVTDAMEKDQEHEPKNVMLHKVTHPFLHSTFIGQYRGYQDHLMEDTQTLNISRTPTYATVVLGVQDENWFGVPFYLTSGKAVSKREGFVRVVFQKHAFSHFNIAVPECMDSVPEIQFTFNSDKPEYHHGHSITVQPPISELITDHSSAVKDGSHQCEPHVLMSSSSSTHSHVHAYTSVITGLIRGDKHLFVPLANIIQSWKVWTPLVRELELVNKEGTMANNLVIYDKDLVEKLSLITKGTKLITTYTGGSTQDSYTVLGNDNSIMTMATNNMEALSIQDHTVYMASRSLVLTKLASDIHAFALRSVDSKGSFNLALPGGSSPLELFQILSLDYRDTFPWESTHIWQTDERCVETSSPDSNIHQLRLKLLDLVNIPPSNVHPMIPNG